MYCLIIQISIKEFILFLKLSLKIQRCIHCVIFRQTGQGAWTIQYEETATLSH